MASQSCQNSIAHHMVTAAFEIDGFRSGHDWCESPEDRLYTQLSERTRGEAFDLMVQHGSESGNNITVGTRYDATEVMQGGVTEVLAYGTAGVREPTTQK